jgi:hypothetical protein
MSFRFLNQLPWRRLAAVTPFLFCLSCSGGGGFNPVHGKVLQNNEPVPGVRVTLHPKQKEKARDLPIGITDEDGSFTLRTGKADGAPEGEYIVTFVCLQQAEEKPGKKKEKTLKMTMGNMETEDRFKGAYSNASSSTIKVEIKSGKNEIGPFNLK